MGFLASRNMVLIKQPRFWWVFNLKFSYNVGPKSLFSLKKKNPKISTSHTDNVFLVSKTWFLRNTPRFRQVLILEFWYNVGLMSLHSSKSPRFWQAKVGHGFLASKNEALMKHSKILTRANPKISIRCKPNISVLFKSPKILTSKSKTWVFWVSKTWFLWNTPRFWQVFYLTFWNNIGPKIYVLFKSPRFWQAK